MFFSAAFNLTSQFTGKERDTETGLDYFMARYFSSAQGRFTSPDPLLASARLTDPQTWNRYAYVRNNPLNYVDPDGRMTSEIQWAMAMGMALPFVNGISGSQNFFDSSYSGYMYNQAIFNNEQYLAYCIKNDPIALQGLINDANAQINLAAAQAAIAASQGMIYGIVDSIGGTVVTATYNDTKATESREFGNEVPAESVVGAPVAVNWIIPSMGIGGVGPAGGFIYNNSPNSITISIGIGVSAGNNVSVGTLPWGRMFNGSQYPAGSDAIFGGWSLSGGINSPILWGLHGTINADGAAGGPSVGIPGASLSLTWGVPVKLRNPRGN